MSLPFVNDALADETGQIKHDGFGKDKNSMFDKSQGQEAGKFALKRSSFEVCARSRPACGASWIASCFPPAWAESAFSDSQCHRASAACTRAVPHVRFGRCATAPRQPYGF